MRRVGCGIRWYDAVDDVVSRISAVELLLRHVRVGERARLGRGPAVVADEQGPVLTRRGDAVVDADRGSHGRWLRLVAVLLAPPDLRRLPVEVETVDEDAGPVVVGVERDGLAVIIELDRHQRDAHLLGVVHERFHAREHLSARVVGVHETSVEMLDRQVADGDTLAHGRFQLLDLFRAELLDKQVLRLLVREVLPVHDLDREGVHPSDLAINHPVDLRELERIPPADAGHGCVGVETAGVPSGLFADCLDDALPGQGLDDVALRGVEERDTERRRVRVLGGIQNLHAIRVVDGNDEHAIVSVLDPRLIGVIHRHVTRHPGTLFERIGGFGDGLVVRGVRHPPLLERGTLFGVGVAFRQDGDVGERVSCFLATQGDEGLVVGEVNRVGRRLRGCGGRRRRISGRLRRAPAEGHVAASQQQPRECEDRHDRAASAVDHELLLTCGSCG